MRLAEAIKTKESTDLWSTISNSVEYVNFFKKEYREDNDYIEIIDHIFNENIDEKPNISEWCNIIASFVGHSLVYEYGSGDSVNIIEQYQNPIVAVANYEAGTSNNLRLMKSVGHLTNGRIKVDISKNCATNLGASDLIIASYICADTSRLEMILLKSCEVTQSALEQNFKSFSLSNTGKLAVEGEFDINRRLASSSKAMQLCFNLERYMIAKLLITIGKNIQNQTFSTFFKNKDLSQKQFIQDKIINMYTSLKPLEIMMSNTLFDIKGYETNDLLSYLKVNSIEMLSELIDYAIEVKGPHSLNKESSLLDFKADLQFLKFLGGTRELHKTVIINTLSRNYNE